MPGSGLSPLILPNLMCSGCGKVMDILELHDDRPKEKGLPWGHGYMVHASCHDCRTSFEVSLIHSSARNLVYQGREPNEELEEVPEVG